MHFRHLFDAVHPFFWPVLYWQLKRAWLCLQREKLNAVLIAVTWWGGVRIVHRGDKVEQVKPNPFALTKPRYDNPVWFTDVPSALLDAPFILPRTRAGLLHVGDCFLEILVFPGASQEPLAF